MPESNNLRTRIARAVEDGDFAFWEEVVKVFPEAVTGDLDPDVVSLFTQIAEASIGDWLRDVTGAENLTSPPAWELVPTGLLPTDESDAKPEDPGLRARLSHALDMAETAFWQTVASALLSSGDVRPDAEDMRPFRLIARASLRRWVSLNVPGADVALGDAEAD
jgi:hypothetical protein